MRNKITKEKDAVRLDIEVADIVEEKNPSARDFGSKVKRIHTVPIGEVYVPTFDPAFLPSYANSTIGISGSFSACDMDLSSLTESIRKEQETATENPSSRVFGKEKWKFSGAIIASRGY